MKRPLRVGLAGGLACLVCLGGFVGFSSLSSSSDGGQPPAPSITSRPLAEPPSESPQAAPVSLKENQLNPLKGFGYQKPPGGDAAALSAVASSAEHPEYLLGFISRMITTPKGPVGGVQLLRFRPETPVLDDQSVAASFEEYAQAPGQPLTVAGRQTLGINNARGADVGVLMWADGHDLVTVFAGSLSDAKVLAANYLRKS